jgi:HNH endonuclease
LEYRYEDYIYNSETGLIRWADTLEYPHYTRVPGKEAGFSDHKGYRKVSVRGRKQKFIHQIAWFCVYGEWVKLIDHKDRNTENNKIGNLRKASERENQHNRKDNFSKVPSVRKRWKGYEVRVHFKNKNYYKTLPSEAEATEYYWNKLKELQVAHG